MPSLWDGGRATALVGRDQWLGAPCPSVKSRKLRRAGSLAEGEPQGVGHALIMGRGQGNRPRRSRSVARSALSEREEQETPQGGIAGRGRAAGGRACPHYGTGAGQPPSSVAISGSERPVRA